MQREGGGAGFGGTFNSGGYTNSSGGYRNNSGGFGNNSGGYTNSQYGGYSSRGSQSSNARGANKKSNVGDVTIRISGQAEKQVSKNVGENVDFEEIKN